MAVILAESVAITKSRLAKGFNGDNLNLNGKVLTTADADNGFKAAGSVKPPYVAVVASGNQKGFAAGAVDAFNDYAKDINFNKYNAQVIIDKYFDDMQSVVDNCGIENSRLSIGIVCAYDDCVIAAKTGDCHLLRFSEGELFEIALSDDEGGRGFQFVDVIADGDVYALVGEEASADLDYDAIVTAFDSNADLKTIIRDFYKSLSVTAAGKDCSVVLMKLKSDTEYTYASAPAMMFADDNEDGNTDEFEAEPPIDAQELMSSDGYVSNSERPEVEKKPVLTKKKILNFIPVAILIIILAITAALYFSTHLPAGNNDDGENSSNPDIIVGAEADETGDYNGSNGMQDVDDTEHGGDVGAVEEDDDEDNNAETTTSSTTTTRETERTTETPNRPSSTTTTTTEADETTTEVAETTTESTETTTETQEQETTTQDAPADATTQAPDTNTQAPDTTTQATPEEPVAEPVENA